LRKLKIDLKNIKGNQTIPIRSQIDKNNNILFGGKSMLTKEFCILHMIKDSIFNPISKEK
jgi:hypothetical protein